MTVPIFLRQRFLVPAALLILLLLPLLSLRVRHRFAPPAALPSLPRAFASKMPARVLWAWEEPEDLHKLSDRTGVAFLAETLLLGHGNGEETPIVMHRRQPLLLSDRCPRMAVVRLEAGKRFHAAPGLELAIANEIAAVARHGEVAAVQVDFDAAVSQRTFYAAVLQQLRRQLPAGLPLSITALVSWCGPGSWLHGLPVDEAVPMFFRMGGPLALVRGNSGLPSYPLAESLCRTSIGLSIDEPWPANVAHLDASTRIYFFAPAPWRADQLAAVEHSPLLSLPQELSR